MLIWVQWVSVPSVHVLPIHASVFRSFGAPPSLCSAPAPMVLPVRVPIIQAPHIKVCKSRATFNAFHRIKLYITIIKLLAPEDKSIFFLCFQFGNKLIYVGILTFHLLIFFSHHLQAFFSGYTVYIYQDSKLLAPVVFFADLVKTSL